jgi:hypothetical protein
VLYLQATKKALSRLGVDRDALEEPGHTESALGNWLVNVVPMGGREAYLFMSTRSLLSFPIMIGALKPGPSDMLSFLEHRIRMLLKELRVPRSQGTLLLQDLNEVALCAVKDWSLVAIYSAVANDYFQAWDDFKGNPGALVAEVNSRPRASLKWATPAEASLELLARSVA